MHGVLCSSGREYHGLQKELLLVALPPRWMHLRRQQSCCSHQKELGGRDLCLSFMASVP